MSLDQWISSCSKAAAANFKCRNVKVFSDVARHQQIVHKRRNEVRHWITEMRLATNPATAQIIAQRVFWQVN